MGAVSSKHQKTSAAQFVVIDLDRTIFKTSQFFDDVCGVFEEAGILTSDALTRFRASVESLAGKDPDWLFILENKYGGPSSADVKEVIEHFLDSLSSHALSEKYIYDGVAELFDQMDAVSSNYVVMTKGNVVIQTLKLKILNVVCQKKIPSYVTDAVKKAAWIEQHIQTNGNNVVVPVELTQGRQIVVSTIIVIDDKPQNLESSSNAVVGILVDNQQPHLKGTVEAKGIFETLMLA